MKFEGWEKLKNILRAVFKGGAYHPNSWEETS